MRVQQAVVSPETQPKDRTMIELPPLEFIPHPWRLIRITLDRASIESRRYSASQIDPQMDRQSTAYLGLARSADDASVLIRYGLNSGDHDRAPYVFDISWTAEFAVPPDTSTESIREFAMGTGRAALWPYIRNHVADISFRMGFEPFLLPVLVFDQPAVTLPMGRTSLGEVQQPVHEADDS